QQAGSDALAPTRRLEREAPQLGVLPTQLLGTGDAVGEEVRDRPLELAAVDGGVEAHRCAVQASARIEPSAADSSCACSTSQGLNAHGVAVSAAARSAGSTQRVSITSSGLGSN